MPVYKKRKVAAVVAASALLLSGCGMFGGKEASKQIDPPQDISYVKDGQTEEAESSAEKNEDAASVMREIFLIDENGLVVSQQVTMPKTDGVAKQTLQYLVEGGPVSNILPDGFRAVLPPDTEIKGVTIKDGTAVADFSKEFGNYQPDDEMRILQAVTWTLTQFDNVQKVKIWVNGHELKEMPVNGTPITDELSRSDGINFDTKNTVNMTNTYPLTVYFLAENNDGSYYVPVTKRIPNDIKDSYAAAVLALIEGPDRGSGLLSEFQAGLKLNSKPLYKNGEVVLDFNEAIFGAFEEEKKVISQHVLNSLVLSLTEQKGVESVSVQVNGKAELVKEDGQKLTEPVSRPEDVNTGSF
ncbi:sporulation protein [Bacillus lacus]|uniref:Sporulation protein n=1 Tax=Metabacillus lacus TaxID=1983721 RepID=A0A7X2IY43_9BACI|nr:GerMN domain-containing protein [Metabacillus lacus]MRX71816.1 sporulation protein [Metabacillus lacus]